MSASGTLLWLPAPLCKARSSGAPAKIASEDLPLRSAGRSREGERSLRLWPNGRGRRATRARRSADRAYRAATSAVQSRQAMRRRAVASGRSTVARPRHRRCSSRARGGLRMTDRTLPFVIALAACAPAGEEATGQSASAITGGAPESGYLAVFSLAFHGQ